VKAAPRYSARCYACDATATGLRDRRPEGGTLESACKRHADPAIPSFRRGSALIPVDSVPSNSYLLLVPDMTTTALSATASRVLANARRMGTDAFHAAAALDIVAPVAGRTWTAMCCGCACALDPHDEWPSYYVTHERTAAWNWCATCAYSGPDTLVVSVPLS
jgi:hypothetical protein